MWAFILLAVDIQVDILIFTYNFIFTLKILILFYIMYYHPAQYTSLKKHLNTIQAADTLNVISYLKHITVIYQKNLYQKFNIDSDNGFFI